MGWVDGQQDPQTAWATCPRADWMLWLARWLGIDHTQRVRALCACARTGLKYLPEGEERPLRAIEVTERWCAGTATEEDIDQARGAAYDAATTYFCGSAASFVAHAAFAVAFFPYRNTYTGVDVVSAVASAAYAAYANGSIEPMAFEEMADMVRQHITFEDMLAAASTR